MGEKYKNLGNGFKLTMQEGGISGLFLGWAPTAIGYSAQGLCKFGFYEVFKKLYADAMGEENAYLYMTGLYLAASASAEFFADIALSPMEACKVRIQTSPVGTFPTTLRGAFPKIMAAEGINGFYKSVVALYDYVVPKPRAECSKAEQLVVTFAAGYIAGVLPQQGSRCRHWCCREDSWFWRTLAGSWPQDRYDWNPDCPSMVHL